MALTPFGKELRKLRVDRDISAAELGKQIGISKTFVSFIENGHRSVPGKTFAKLLEVLHCTAAEERTLRIAHDATEGVVRIRVSTVAEVEEILRKLGVLKPA